MASNETDPTDSGGETTHAAIVHSSDDAIISYDLADKVTSLNGGAERLFGYTADEILGQPITTLIPPHQRGEALAAFQRLQSGERRWPLAARSEPAREAAAPHPPVARPVPGSASGKGIARCLPETSPSSLQTFQTTRACIPPLDLTEHNRAD